MVGYSLAFDGTGDLIGGLDYAFLKDVTFEPRNFVGTEDPMTIPHLLFFAFQATFCIITVALISGAVVERMRFSAFLVFAALWSVARLRRPRPLGLRRRLAVRARHARLRRRHPGRDGLRLLGPGRGAGGRRPQGLRPPGAAAPQLRSTSCVGAGLLWFGWFGFNGGSGFGTGDASVLAFTNTLLCPAAHLVTWFVLDAIRGRKVTAVGAATAIIVGCVLITPAGGFISPGWAMALGAAGAIPC